jgi:two-component sensor histidine kinase/HAMP domain-containing protein
MPADSEHSEITSEPVPPGLMQVGVLSATLIWLVFVVLLAAVLLWQVGEYRLRGQEVREADQIGRIAISMIAGVEDRPGAAAILRQIAAASPDVAMLRLATSNAPLPTGVHPDDVVRVSSDAGRTLLVALSPSASTTPRLWGTLGALMSLGAVFVLMGVFLVVVIGRLVGRPIRQLERRAAQLADGKTDVVIPVGGHGDFGTLARSLDRIGDRMHTERVQNERISQELQRTNSLQCLMLRELNHRIRNNLASLSALVSLSRAQEPSVPVFAKRIERRIEAMAAIHGLLSERNWSPVSLLDLLSRLSPLELGERIKLVGPDIDVSAAEATPLAMVLQEMFANAMEHGSLGSGAGWLQVQWDIGEGAEGEIIVIDWRETGGPPPNSDAVAGTGTQLIRGLIEGELRGDVTLHHTPDGVSHRIRIPLKPGTRLGSV